MTVEVETPAVKTATALVMVQALVGALAGAEKFPSPE